MNGSSYFDFRHRWPDIDSVIVATFCSAAVPAICAASDTLATTRSPVVRCRLSHDSSTFGPRAVRSARLAASTPSAAPFAANTA